MRRARAFVVAIAITAAAEGATLRLTWQTSGEPASALEVWFDGTAHARSGRDGNVEVPAGALRVRVVDRGSRLELVNAAVEPALRVPEPLRVRGTIANARGGVRVRIGDGTRAEDARRPHEIALPAAPSRWQDAEVRGRRFTTPWIVAGSPQLIAQDGSGALAAIDVALPARLAARQWIDAGDVTLSPTASVDVDIALPAGDRATSVAILVTEAPAADRDAAAVARHLRALQQVDPPMYRLLAHGHAYPLSPDGKAHLRFLPGFTRMRIVLLEPFGEGRAVRDLVPTPGAPSRLHFEWKELAGGPPRDVTGVVKLEGTETPVAGATVVLRDPPLRRETVTGSDGRFSFAGVTAREPLRISVDARGRVPRSHRQTATLRAEGRPEITLPLPRETVTFPRVVANNVPANCLVDDFQYPFIFNQQIPANGVYEAETDYAKKTITLRASITGVYGLLVFFTPFLVFNTQVDVTQAGALVVGKLQGDDPIALTFNVRTGNNGDLAPGTPVYLAPPAPLAPWFDPTEFDLDANSKFTIPCINSGQTLLFVESGDDVCDGAMTFPPNSLACTFFLPPASNPCKCR